MTIRATNHLHNPLLESTVVQPIYSQQLTNASTVDFASIAINCGYKESYSTDNTNDFSNIIKKKLKNTFGPTFIHIKIQKGSINNLGRPTIHPKDVAIRFKNFLKN